MSEPKQVLSVDWIRGGPFIVTSEIWNGFKKVKKWFGCGLCGNKFEVGNGARFIYSHAGVGNFFVCSECDGLDEEVLRRAQESYRTAVRMAKQWGIYGPDWQRE